MKGMNDRLGLEQISESREVDQAASHGFSFVWKLLQEMCRHSRCFPSILLLMKVIRQQFVAPDAPLLSNSNRLTNIVITYMDYSLRPR